MDNNLSSLVDRVKNLLFKTPQIVNQGLSNLGQRVQQNFQNKPFVGGLAGQAIQQVRQLPQQIQAIPQAVQQFTPQLSTPSYNFFQHITPLQPPAQKFIDFLNPTKPNNLSELGAGFMIQGGPLGIPAGAGTQLLAKSRLLGQVGKIKLGPTIKTIASKVTQELQPLAEEARKLEIASKELGLAMQDTSKIDAVYQKYIGGKATNFTSKFDAVRNKMVETNNSWNEKKYLLSKSQPSSPLEGGVKGTPPLSPTQGILPSQAQKPYKVGKVDGGGVVKISKSTQLPIERIQQEFQQGVKNIRIAPEARILIAPQKVSLKSGNLGGVSGIPSQMPPAGSLPKSIAQTDKYAFNINKQRLDLTKSEKGTLDQIVDAIKPELQKIKGKVLSNDEVIKATKSSDILQKITTREEAFAAEAATLRARQRLVELDKNIDQLVAKGNTPQLQTQMRDLIDSLRVVSANAADTGRKLQSLSIEAGDESIRVQVLKDIARVSNNTDEILKAAQGVDWNNANSITKFYRQFIKPTIPEILDEYRYNNMLSNPITHLRNDFSNLMQTFITRPLTLTAEGRPIEALKYLSGAVKNFPQAIDDFVKSMKGETVITKPDLERISTGKLPGFMTIPTREMEAGDKFFSALIRGGELARGQTLEQAGKIAEYSLFRQGLKPEGQGVVLNAIDSMTAWTYNAPKAVRWFVPFIRTPMNFAKQWIEYSPAGVSTLIGAGNKREQIAKVILGSIVTGFGANLAMQNRTTWATPTDKTEKELFYASGKKPFSILIGDKWVSMMYAGPFAFALALPAAAKFYQDDSKTALTDDGLSKLTKTATSMAQFLSGQTFLTGLGNFVNWASGDADYSLGSNLAFTAGQVVPLQGLLRYISTIMDPIYRKPKGFGESFLKDIPGFSQGLKPYTEPTGEPATRLPINYIIPYDVGKRKQSYEPMLQQRTQDLQTNALVNSLKKQAEEGQVGNFPIESIVGGSVYRAETMAGTQKLSKIQETQLRNLLTLTTQTDDPQILQKVSNSIQKLGGRVQGNGIVAGNTFYYPEDGDIKTIKMDFTVPEPKLTGDSAFDKELLSTYKTALSNEINNVRKLYEQGIISQEKAIQLVNDVVVKYDAANAKTKKPKAPKKVSFKKITAKKLPTINIAKTKVKTFKIKKTPTFKLSKIKQAKIKLSTYKAPRFKTKKTSYLTFRNNGGMFGTV